MTIDLPAALASTAGQARVLDRRRLDLILGRGGPEGMFAALDGYRNPDGGYGWGLEADLRAPESQTGAAAHAFEAMGDAGPATTPHAAGLCDWLASVSRPDGGLPFVVPFADPAATSPWWVQGDTTTSSLQITSITLARAHRVARHDPAVAAHPWLATATDWCLAAIDDLADDAGAHIVGFCLQLLDALADDRADAVERLERFRPLLGADGVLPVRGGVEGEAIRPLDYAPVPGRPVRALLDPAVVTAELDRLESLQQPDGGWVVDFASASPAAALDWRGDATVRALQVLHAEGRVDLASAGA